jgi:hypothetical protein
MSVNCDPETAKRSAGAISALRLFTVSPLIEGARGSGQLRRGMQYFDVLGVVAGSPGQRRAWSTGDASARVIYQEQFTDGTSAILSTAVP